MSLALYSCFYYGLLISYLELSILYILLLLMYLLALINLRSIQVYYFCASVLMWLFLAIFLLLGSCFTVILTCGKYILG